MTRSVTLGLAAAGLLLSATSQAQPAAQPGRGPGAGPNPYTLEPGVQLEYATSGSLTGSDLPGGGEKSQFQVRFTVLAKAAEGLTVYAAVIPEQDLTTSGSEEEVGGRFTFQIQNDGSLGERMAGVAIPPFMGWSPALYFPPIPADERSTISLPLPALGIEIPVEATRAAEGGDISVTYSLDKSVFGGQAGAEDQSPIAGFTGRYVFASAEKSVKASSSALDVRQRGPEGKTASIKLQLSATRTSVKTLAAKDLDTLRKDVTAAIRAFDEVRQSIGNQQDQNTTAAVASLDAYLKEFPQGEFSRIFQEQKKAILSMTARAANAAQTRVGVPAPDFSAKTLDGSTVKLADLKGRVVFLDFWATWCGPCVKEIPHVKELQQRFADKGLTILGISGDRTEKDLRDFVKENGIAWKQIWQAPDSEGTVLEQYGIEKFPTTILLDRQGVIQAVDLRGQELEQKVEELLQTK